MAKPWLEKKNLQEWLKTPIKEIKSEESNAKGDNYLSTMCKLVVKAEDGRTFPLIVKCRLVSGTTADVFGKTAIYKKEVEFYRNTAHALQGILWEAFPDDKPMFPKCYYACEDFLVMEDLLASGFKMYDRRVGFDLEKCLLILRTLAKLHAASVILHERNPRSLDQFDINFLQEPSLQTPMGNFITGFALTLAEELKTWDKEWHQYIPKLKLLAKNSIAGIRDNSSRRDGDFNVLLHGDLWTNNLLLRESTAGIRILDFQLANYGSPVIDLHYFFATSATEDVRVNHFHRLMEEYHKSLFETLMAMNYNKHVPTLEELHQEFDRASLYGLFSIIGPYAVMQCDTEIGFSFDETLSTGNTPGPCVFGDNYKRNIKLALPFLSGKGGFDNVL